MGGVASIEITNESKGWHLHAHLLLDIRWLDKQQLSEEWGRQVGQDFAIVDIKDARSGDYAKQVAKYVVKGADMATWPGNQIWEFISAIKGIRFFTAFGSVNKHREEIKRIIAAAKPAPVACACGCHQFTFESETDAVLNEVRREARRKR
jgi:hypothetical protein